MSYDGYNQKLWKLVSCTHGLRLPIAHMSLSHPQLSSIMTEDSEITPAYLNIFQVYREVIIESASSKKLECVCVIHWK